MFGMPLEGAMLESFTGEFGNMIAGNLCTFTGQHDLELDITLQLSWLATPSFMASNKHLSFLLHLKALVTFLFYIRLMMKKNKKIVRIKACERFFY